MNEQFIKKYARGLFKKLSENFTLAEYECHCSECSETIVDMTHVARLEQLRRELGDKSIKINSAFRCADYNSKVGGVKSSQHLLGKATDLDLKKPSDSDIDRLKIIFTGVIIYDKFVHVDSRANKIYLDKRTKNENETK